MEKLTKADILSVRPGKYKAFLLDSRKAIQSARQYVYQISRVEPPDGVDRFKTKVDYSSMTIIVEAIAKRD